jgi:hypothetical protein
MEMMEYSAGYGGGMNAFHNPNHHGATRMAARIIPDYPKSEQPPKVITCTDGTEVLVDAEDYPLLSRHSWYINWSGEKPYAITKMKTDLSTIWRCIFMHHMILGGGSTTDHESRNTLDNQKHNLRAANSQQNAWNTGKRQRCSGGKPPSSQYKGVVKQPNGKFMVHIKLTKKGVKPEKYFRKSGIPTELEAAQFYNKKIVELRGEWAWINPLDIEVAETK